MSIVRRREFLISAAAFFAASASVVAQAQRATRIVRIGWLGPTPSEGLDALRAGLREQGYVEGQNFVLEISRSIWNPEQLPDIAKDLATQNVDVIVVSSIRGAVAAQNATTVIPIVCAACGNLADSGLVRSLARPGGNLTGLSLTFSETASKLAEIAKELLPKAKRAAVIWGGAGNAFWVQQKAEFEKAASQLSLRWYAPQNAAELANAFGAIREFGPDFLVTLSTGFTYSARQDIVKFAMQNRLPALYDIRQYVEDGGLISYGADVLDSFRRSAGYVDRILKGARPAELPIELPSKFELAINLRASRALGLAMPQSLLLRADRTIE